MELIVIALVIYFIIPSKYLGFAVIWLQCLKMWMWEAAKKAGNKAAEMNQKVADKK